MLAAALQPLCQCRAGIVVSERGGGPARAGFDHHAHRKLARARRFGKYSHPCQRGIATTRRILRDDGQDMAVIGGFTGQPLPQRRRAGLCAVQRQRFGLR